MTFLPRTLAIHLARWSRALVANRSGNFGIIFALVAAPLMVAVGASVDFARAYNVQNKMQSDLDSALLQAVKDMGNKDEEAIKQQIRKWFASQTSIKDTFDLGTAQITVDKTTNVITASVKGKLDTTFMRITGMTTMNVLASSSVQGASDTYYEIHIILDKSASMLLAATTADQAVMQKLSLNCVFACHSTVYAETYQGVYYSSYYDYARKKGVTLRSDVQVNAVDTLMDTIDKVDPTNKRIKIALYSLGTDTTGSSLTSGSYDVKKGIRQIRSLTNDTKQIRTDVNTKPELTSATSYASTDFRALTALPDYITANGDGKSANSPYKLVVMITDGTQSSEPWVFSGYSNITPINPTWCNSIKNKGVSFAVLYTEYLPWTNRTEYNRSLGATMSSSTYSTQWGATMPSPSSVSRHDYLSQGLTSCASQKEYFISASSPSAIETGLTTIVGQYLGKVRITN